MTMTITGTGAFAGTLTALTVPTRLDDLEAAAREFTDRHPRDLVRTITFRYGPSHYQTGTVTGLVVGATMVGDTVESKAQGRLYDGLRVVMCSAGCAHPKPYVIPAGAVIEAIER